MHIQMLITATRDKIILEENTKYELDSEQPIIGNEWKVKIPMKQKGKFRYALIGEKEGVLVD